MSTKTARTNASEALDAAIEEVGEAKREMERAANRLKHAILHMMETRAYFSVMRSLEKDEEAT